MVAIPSGCRLSSLAGKMQLLDGVLCILKLYPQGLLFRFLKFATLENSTLVSRLGETCALWAGPCPKA